MHSSVLFDSTCVHKVLKVVGNMKNNEVLHKR